MASVYALPVPPSSQVPSASPHSLKTHKKRTVDGEAKEPGQGLLHDDTSEPEEYAAVITPGERAQRRLAGHSFVKDLPNHPFPHRAPRPPRNRSTEAVETESRIDNLEESYNEPPSLRMQHLSAMSAVLHQSLLKRDYARARRALGLILRTDVHGTPIDIRAAGNWGIGAEILFRQYDQPPSPGPSITARHERRRRGFADAKDFYEMLVVQYPFHRSRPESVNAIDFYFAMFSLWIYVAQAEGQDIFNDHLQSDDQMPESSEQAESRRQELQQANEIGARMDKCMATAPYNDNRDLLKLRAMVAEWQADLSDEVEDTASEAVFNPENEACLGRSTSATLSSGLAAHGETPQHLHSASTKAREKAQKIYELIGRPRSFTD